MPKSEGEIVSVISPKTELVGPCAQAIRRALRTPWVCLESAGPEARPSVVVAVLQDHDAAASGGSSLSDPDREVLEAVARATGLVVVLGVAAAGDAGAAGVAVPAGCFPVPSAAAAAELLDSWFLDRDQWRADAYRADMERLERVRNAVRLEGGRIIDELAGAGLPRAGHNVDAVTTIFAAHLRVLVAEQAVACPPVEGDEGGVELPSHLQRPAAGSLVGAGMPLALGVSIVTGLGIALGLVRLLLSLEVGLGLAGGIGLVVFLATTGIGVGIRWWMLRQRAVDTWRREVVVWRRAQWAAMVQRLVAQLSIDPIQLPGRQRWT